MQDMPEITHDPDRKRYSLIADGAEAYLTYETPQPHIMHITHTIVPDALGGRGYGKRLVTRAIEDAIMVRAQKISSGCWFATALIEKNEDWQKALA